MHAHGCLKCVTRTVLTPFFVSICIDPSNGKNRMVIAISTCQNKYIPRLKQITNKTENLNRRNSVLQVEWLETITNNKIVITFVFITQTEMNSNL